MPPDVAQYFAYGANRYTQCALQSNFVTQALVRRLSTFSPEKPADIRPYDFLPMKIKPQCSPERATRPAGLPMVVFRIFPYATTDP
jgi:hypothetical protein